MMASLANRLGRGTVPFSTTGPTRWPDQWRVENWDSPLASSRPTSVDPGISGIEGDTPTEPHRWPGALRCDMVKSDIDPKPGEQPP